jgi:predicted  nucleic acid-binding Zn-ribbon protein
VSQISILYRLQQIDRQLDDALLSLQNIEKELSDDSIIQAAERKISDAELKYQNELKKLHEAQNKSKNVRLKIEQSEASLYGGKIQNPKELQDLQNEIAALKRLITTLEDHELEEMMAAEEAETQYKKEKEAITSIQGEQIEKHAMLKGEKTNLTEKINRLEAERNVTLPAIPADDLSLYEQLRKTRNGVAVAKITSRACGACGTTLTAALVQSTQLTGQLVRCPTCGRILYHG